MKKWNEYRILELLGKESSDAVTVVWDASNSMSNRLGAFHETHKEPSTWTPPDLEFNDLVDLSCHVWFGNHYHDQNAFDAADRLFCKYVECNEFAMAKKCSNIVVTNGMGIHNAPALTDDKMFEMYDNVIEFAERNSE